MESLPEEMMDEICQYLSTSDLASCCTVSCSWREVFGNDRLWRVHCDETVSEHLDVSNCVVEPHFTSPEAADSTLSPIGEWRLNYMKEVRVRNNFRSANFKMEELYATTTVRSYALCVIFVDNGHVLMLNQNYELEVWDVKKESVFKTKFSFNVLSKTAYSVDRDSRLTSDLFPVNGSNIFVAVDWLFVRVYRMCVVSYTLTLLHVFSFEMTEKCADSTEEMVQELFSSQHGYVATKCSVVGNFLVGIRNSDEYGVNNDFPMKMHIWNVETGEKLKEEERPPSTVYIQSIKTCEKSMNILIEGVELQDVDRGLGLGQWYVYSLTQLMFNPFHKVHELKRVMLDVPGFYQQAIIFEKYVAIRVDETLSVYDSLTSELLYTSPCNRETELFFCRHYLSFQHKYLWNVYNPRKRSSLANLDVNNSVHSNMPCFDFRFSDNSYVKYFTFRIKDGSKTVFVPTIVEVRRFRPPLGSVNQSHTKYVKTEYDRGCTKVIVVHFW